jgi:hypothetical protein
MASYRGARSKARRNGPMALDLGGLISEVKKMKEAIESLVIIVVSSLRKDG